MSDMDRDDDELDRMLVRSFGPPHTDAAHAESIEPSSGFAASVMERVREEAAAAAALGPIRFPWRRAVPGICMVVLAVAVCATLLMLASIGAVQLASHAASSATAAGPRAAISEWTETAMRLHLGWLGIGMMIAFVPFTLSRGWMGGRQRT
jgi:ferric-dicitrate binding protein FerR (iron transport regulator)